MAETANPRGAVDNEALYAILFTCQARNSTYILSIHSSVWNSVKLEQLERLRSEDTPVASWLPIPLSHIGSQVKGRQSQSYKFKKKSPKFQIFEFETGITRDTPSEVAW